MPKDKEVFEGSLGALEIFNKGGKGRAEQAPASPEVVAEAGRQAGLLTEKAAIMATTREHIGRVERTVKHANAVKLVMDTLPVDAALGVFVPGLGDMAMNAPGLIIVAEAIHAGVPKSIIAKMLLSLLVDTAVGSVPFVGDILDYFLTKSNKWNAKILADYLEKAKREAGIS